jgi:anti-sigma regulatory factor (Ser/Thr protein kinase)
MAGPRRDLAHVTAEQAPLPTSQVSTTLPPEARSARRARVFVATVLDDWGCGHVADLVELLTSELVTNGILHAETGVDVRIDRSPDGTIRVSVGDEGAGRPDLRDVPLDAVRGRGLAMVHRGALRWGIDETPVGKEVWFEVNA